MFAHLGLADRLLGGDGGEHADERLLDVLGQLVDHVVRADLDALALGEARVSAFGRTLKPTTMPSDAAASMMSFSVMPPTPWWMTLTRTSGVLDLPELADDRLDGALHVALDDDVQVLHLAGLQVLEQVLERDARRRPGRELLAAQPLGALLRELAGLAVGLDDAAELAGGRRLVEAEDLDRVARLRLLELVALVVVERAHLAPGVAGDDRVADLERAALDEHRRDRAAADVEPRLDDRAGRPRVRVRLQVELGVGDEQHLLEQLVEARLLLRRDAGDLRVAAPLLGLEPLGRELARARARGSRRAGRSC